MLLTNYLVKQQIHYLDFLTRKQTAHYYYYYFAQVFSYLSLPFLQYYCILVTIPTELLQIS